jgi:gamma-resorcylate decarboxylase
MLGKIGIEEHFATAETLADSSVFLPNSCWPKLSGRLLDVREERIGVMDACGMEMMILSLNAPTVQAISDPRRANEVARRANDALANEVARRPDRFAALAALPMQDVGLASRELERCVTELGFCGALVNGFSQLDNPQAALYYDTPDYWPFWETVERLEVPFYLHPRNPLPGWGHIYEGHSWLLGAPWAFGVEAATHALRLMGSGLFDRCPRLNMILGHLGEGLPCSMWRVDNYANWAKATHRCPAKNPIGEYFRANFNLTTSGNLRSQTLVDAMLEIGADRIMFSTDYPFEMANDAADWFDAAPISESDRIKIGRLNAIRLFKLPLQ